MTSIKQYYLFITILLNNYYDQAKKPQASANIQLEEMIKEKEKLFVKTGFVQMK